MILIGQYDSSFVRRVGIALRLYGHAFDHRPWSVFSDKDKIRPYNPLMRVPVLVLDDEDVLVDCNLMLDHLDRQAPGEKSLWPAEEPDRHRALKVSGLATGLKAADPDLGRLFDLYGATRWQRLTRLSIPSAIPYLLEGIKVAGGLSIIGVVVAEFVAGSGGAQGLAWRILEAEHQLKTAQMFAALVVLGVLGAGLNGLLSLIERALLKTWRGR